MITWEVEIIPQNVAGKTAYIRGTRTDSEDPSNPRQYQVSGWLGTSASRLALLDELFAKHLAFMELDAQTKTFLEGLEAQAKTNLEARE
ncbi:MAG: hypothetical protein KAS32_01960 [Candidatus Peribacteraceae bacterium]|nr:hypothetical protein [Candidatus Peribacteraceae bacterium]